MVCARVPVGLRYCGGGDVSVFMLWCAARTKVYTQTDATSSNENKSLHILQTARRRRGARGRACQHLHTSSRWHSYAKMRDLHTHNRCCGPARTLTHTHICIKRFILIYDHDVGAKTYCFLERAVYRWSFLSHCSHFFILHSPIAFPITLRADFNANVGRIKRGKKMTYAGLSKTRVWVEWNAARCSSTSF